MKGPHYPARWAAGLAVLLALVGWLWPAAVEEVRFPVVAPAAGAAPAAPAASAASRVAAARAEPVRPGFRPPTSWDLCGIGRMPVPPGARFDDLTELPAHLGEQPLALARERTLAALRAGDVRARAAEMLLRPLKPTPQPVGEGVDAAFVPMALASRDPVALAWALTVCHAGKLGDDCTRSVARALVEAEPDNAAAWGLWFRWSPEPEATWQRLLQSPRWDSHFGAFARTLAPAIPPDLPGYLRLALLHEAMVLDPVLSPMPGGGWAQRCSAVPAKAPPGDCDRLATLLVERGDTLLTLGLGRGLGRKAGWPEERVAAADAEFQSLQATAVAVGTLQFEQPLSCDAAQAAERRLVSLGSGGELQHLRDERQRQRPR